METNKPFNIWSIFIPLNIILLIILYAFFSHNNYGNDESLEVLAILAGISLLSSAIAISIAKYDTAKKKLWGLAIPLIAGVVVAYLWWVVETCTGKFCGMIEAMIAAVIVIGTIIFIPTYIMSRIILRKGNGGVVQN